MKGLGTTFAAFGLAICAVAYSHAQQIGATDLLRGLADPSRWLTHSGDYTSKRHSPLTQITPENVARLTPVWAFEAGLGFGRGAKFEATPIAIDGTLYVTGLLNHAWAIDGRTGKAIWHYERDLPPATRVCCGMVNRGFAVFGDRLFMTTLDAHVIATRSQDRYADLGCADDRLSTGLLRNRRAARRQGQADCRNGRRRARHARISRRVQSGDRQTHLALQHRPCAWRTWWRHLARRSLRARWWPDVDYRLVRSRTEPPLLGRWESEPGLLRRQSPRRQPLYRIGRGSRSRHRTTAVALSVHAARRARLGFESDPGARRSHDRWTRAQDARHGESKRIPLRARSHERRVHPGEAVRDDDVGEGS